MTRRLSVECWIGLLLTGLALYLHGVFLFHAGGLWRDECVSWHVATLPSIGEAFDGLSSDSFPGFLHVLLRGWNVIGLGQHDLDIRLFGFLTGGAVLLALWYDNRTFAAKSPLLSLALFALLSCTVRSTDSIRAYGLGTVCIILTFGLVWRVVEAPSPLRFGLAALAAVLSVQSLYQNSFLLLAICAGGAAVTLRNGQWKRTVLALSIGLAAALSLLPYASTMRRMAEAKRIFVYRVDLEHFRQVCSQALGNDWRVMPWLWGLLCLGGVGLAALAQSDKGPLVTEKRGRDITFYAAVTMIAAIFGFCVWLRILAFPSRSWYYVPVLALVAAGGDAIFGIVKISPPWNYARPAVAGVIGAFLFANALAGVKMRQTNLDLIAGQLSAHAGANDLVLVYPWYCGATFQRYFHGPATWATLPPLRDESTESLLLLKAAMMTPHAIQPVLDQIAATLKSGHTVWMAGSLPFVPGEPVPPELPPAPQSKWGWDHDAYVIIWSMQAANLIQQHSLKALSCPSLTEQPVDDVEDLVLVAAQGWKDSAP